MSTSNPSPSSSSLTLSDILGTQKQINIFASLTRDIASVSTRLEDPSLNTTILAPLNSAMTSLPRKPWESAQDYETMGTEAYVGQSGQERASENLRRFTERHVVPVNPWEEGMRLKTLEGGEVWWEKREDGRRVIMPGEVEIEGLGKKVGNGEVWVLKGVLGNR